MYRYGAAEHQLVRVDQGEPVLWILDYIDQAVHEPDAALASLDETASGGALRSQARGKHSLPIGEHCPDSLDVEHIAPTPMQKWSEGD